MWLKNMFQTKMGFSKMQNSVRKVSFVQDKTQFSLQLDDSRLQEYDLQSQSRLTQWKHNYKTLLEILTFILNRIPHQKSSVRIMSNTRRWSLAWKSVVKEGYYYPKAWKMQNNFVLNF